MEMIRRLTPALVVLAVTLLFSAMKKWSEKKCQQDRGKENFVLRHPRITLWVGCLGGICFLGLLIWACFVSSDASRILSALVFGGLFLLSVALILSTLSWRVEVSRKKDYFRWISLPFRTCQVYYRDCISYEIKRTTLILKTTGKTFRMDTLTENLALFLEVLDAHHVKYIPQPQKGK